MSNKKKQRSNKRQLKVPQRYTDHIMSNLSQRRNENNELDSDNDVDHTRESLNSDNTQKGSKAVKENMGVFGNKDKGVESTTNVNDSTKPGASDEESVLGGGNDVGIKCSKGIIWGTFGCTNEMAGNTPFVKTVMVETEVVNDNDKGNEDNKHVMAQQSYANVVKKDGIRIDTHLIYIAPNVNEEGMETVLFDEDIVEKGCVKWKTTLCGYFVGANMSFNELRYHLKRMWGRYGLREMFVNNSGINLFKFKDKEGMQFVLDKGPWMVNNRPLFVMQWDPEVGMKKVEPKKLPVWVKMLNIPMEAWSKEGISAFASCLGKPMMMDEMTGRMCQQGVGRTDYARVLVEIEAHKVMKMRLRSSIQTKKRRLKAQKWSM